MSTMNISLPDALKTSVDEQVSQRGYGTSSEYVRELIRRDQDRPQLRSMLMAGGASAPGAPADAGYFEGLRARVRKTSRSGTKGWEPRRSFRANRPTGTSNRPSPTT
jgi:antitoxin ParD1/3/4